jgi:hypothetical protein
MSKEIKSVVISKKKPHTRKLCCVPETIEEVERLIEDGKSGDLIMHAVDHHSVYRLLKPGKIKDEVDKRKKDYRNKPKFIVDQAKWTDDREWDLKTGGPKTHDELVQWMESGRGPQVSYYAANNPAVKKTLEDSIKMMMELKDLVMKGEAVTLPKMASVEASQAIIDSLNSD